MNDWCKYWEEVCKQCTHSYTTKEEPDKLKCRCRKTCNFDDKNLKQKSKTAKKLKYKTKKHAGF